MESSYDLSYFLDLSISQKTRGTANFTYNTVWISLRCQLYKSSIMANNYTFCMNILWNFCRDAARNYGLCIQLFKAYHSCWMIIDVRGLWRPSVISHFVATLLKPWSDKDYSPVRSVRFEELSSWKLYILQKTISDSNYLNYLLKSRYSNLLLPSFGTWLLRLLRKLVRFGGVNLEKLGYLCIILFTTQSVT